MTLIAIHDETANSKTHREPKYVGKIARRLIKAMRRGGESDAVQESSDRLQPRKGVWGVG